MSGIRYEWRFSRPVRTHERIVGGIIAFILALAVSGFSSWRLFGGYEKQISALTGLAGLFLLRFAPIEKADLFPDG